MRHAHQTSESIEVAALLALSGGLMDAYSYLARGGVFANAQTGNILLLGIAVSRADWAGCVRFVLPIAGFVAGIALAHAIKRLVREERLHWRQVALVVEALILLGVALLPAERNLVANSLTSLACGIQVQAFRKLHGRTFATTMCIGNLRSGTQAWLSFLEGRDRSRLADGLLYYGVIGCFALGAVVGSLLIEVAGLRAIWASPVFLAGAFVLLFYDREKARRAPREN